MKNYRVNVRLSYYVYVDVEADNDEDAHDQAVRLAWREANKGRGVWGDEPQVQFLLEGDTE
jgi:hypothetical protein